MTTITESVCVLEHLRSNVLKAFMYGLKLSRREAQREHPRTARSDEYQRRRVDAEGGHVRRERDGRRGQ
eukprot:4875817-Prymnesium_polylepis.1